MGWLDSDSDFAQAFAQAFLKADADAKETAKQQELQRTEFLTKAKLAETDALVKVLESLQTKGGDPAIAETLLRSQVGALEAATPQVTGGDFIGNLMRALGTSGQPTVELGFDENLGALLRQAQAAGEVNRAKESAREIEGYRQKEQAKVEVQKPIKEAEVEGRKEVARINAASRERAAGIRASKEQAKKETAMQKNVDFLAREYERLLKLSPEEARIKALVEVAESSSSEGVTDSSIWNSLTKYDAPTTPEALAKVTEQFEAIKQRVGRTRATQAPPPSPTDPPEKVAARQTVQNFIDLNKDMPGLKDTIIRSNLFKQYGFTPDEFGLK